MEETKVCEDCGGTAYWCDGCEMYSCQSCDEYGTCLCS